MPAKSLASAATFHTMCRSRSLIGCIVHGSWLLIGASAMTLVGRTGCPVFEECGISDFDSRLSSQPSVDRHSFSNRLKKYKTCLKRVNDRWLLNKSPVGLRQCTPLRRAKFYDPSNQFLRHRSCQPINANNSRMRRSVWPSPSAGYNYTFHTCKHQN